MSLDWLDKPLNELNSEQWESLCDGCGKCCMAKLQDAETDKVYASFFAGLFFNQIEPVLFVACAFAAQIDYSFDATLGPYCLNTNRVMKPGQDSHKQSLLLCKHNVRYTLRLAGIATSARMLRLSVQSPKDAVLLNFLFV